MVTLNLAGENEIIVCGCVGTNQDYALDHVQF